MELAPRYCRSCGSRILVKNVCHNCNNDPLKGENYCYDCGALTPNANSCLKCGAKYKTNLPVKPALIIGSLVIITIAITGYFLTRPDKPLLAPEPEKTARQSSITSDTNKTEVQQTKNTINNPVDTPRTITSRQVDSAAIKTPVIDSAKTILPGTFTSDELKAYKGRCSYFSKNQKSQVWFFIAGGSGYIKMNDKVYELKRKRKGVDVAVFSGNEYEATVRIDGLSGSAKEWLASCTLNIKALVQGTSVKHKVYSSCIEL